VNDKAPVTSLRALVVSGFAWNLATTVFLQVVRIVFAIALARFLTPHEYGIASMALLVSMLVVAFSDLGLGAGLVQRANISEEDRSTVFWTSAAFGALLTLIGVGLSGPIASFFGEPDVQPLVAAVSASFVIASLGATHAALLHRQMDFRTIGIRVSASTVVGSVVGVALAASGAGAWSLIAQHLCIGVVSTALLWLSIPWRPRLAYSRRSLSDLGSFGGKLFGVRLLDYARLNGDKLLVGRVLGSVALGTYTVAFNVVLMPLARMLGAAMDTVLPAFSRLQDDRERMASAWLRVNRLASAVFVPALVGLAVVAPDFVTVLLGDRWSDVSSLLQILAVGVIAQAVSALGIQVLTALDRTSALLRFSLVETVVLLGAIVLGLRWGVVGVAAAYSLVHLPTRAYFTWLTTQSLGVPFARFLASLAGVAQACVALVATTLLARGLLLQAGVPAPLRLVVVIVVGAAVYLLFCLWRAPEIRVELGRVRRERLGGAR
jgi:O-antigen/teichoic acid export membrane protein